MGRSCRTGVFLLGGTYLVVVALSGGVVNLVDGVVIALSGSSSYSTKWMK